MALHSYDPRAFPAAFRWRHLVMALRNYDPRAFQQPSVGAIGPNRTPYIVRAAQVALQVVGAVAGEVPVEGAGLRLLHRHEGDEVRGVEEDRARDRVQLDDAHVGGHRADARDDSARLLHGPPHQAQAARHVRRAGGLGQDAAGP